MKLVVSILVAAVLLAFAAWFYRYDHIPTSSYGGMYIADRWTGKLEWCLAKSCSPVGAAPEVAAPAAVDWSQFTPIPPSQDRPKK